MKPEPTSVRITDLHSHVLPAVDDGAQDLDEAMGALYRLIENGVERVVATPHFRASLLERPAREADKIHRFDAAYQSLVAAATAAGLEIAIERGCEFKLDAPSVDLSDPRLRLGGSDYVLVEFASFQLPPFAANQLLGVRDAGWHPLLAHPERYQGTGGALDRVEKWLDEGTRLQVNARSFLGWYGDEAQSVAAELLRRGWITCIASDYHARGRPDLDAALELLRRAIPTSGDAVQKTPHAPNDATEQAIRTLFHENPTRILANEPTVSVPPLALPKPASQKPGRRWFR